MSPGRRLGFTVVEAVVALLLIAVGVLALAGTSALSLRMSGWGRWSTVVAQVAAARMEWLRGLAAAAWPPCTDPRLATGSALTAGVHERWEVSPVGGAARVLLVLEHRRPNGLRSDTAVTALPCR